MKKLIFTYLIFFISIKFSIAQKLVFGMESGIGTYSMENLKLVTNSISGAVPFETKLVDNYPPYLYFRPSVSINFNSYNLGLIFNIQSSGARVSSKDYSGEYSLDLKVKSNSIGIFNEFETNTGKNILSIYNISGINFSEINIIESLIVFDQKAPSENEKLNSESYFTEAGIRAKFKVDKISLGLNLGYNYQFKNKKELTPEWNGVRGGLFVNYIFGNKE
jgi:hypothetical protein